MSNPKKAYKNDDFLNSPEARTIRILCEYQEPLQRFKANKVSDTIVFYGSARSVPVVDAQDSLANAERELARTESDEDKAAGEAEVLRAQRRLRLSEYYDKGRELARRLTEWDMNRMSKRRYYICTGGGPGMMEAANRGAADVLGGRSVGLGISLPFEAGNNEYVTPELSFEFHYFFTRKYWFMYLAKSLVLMPGGFGTFDEMFEALTLRQTGKVTKPMPTVLFGKEYWTSALNFDTMVEWGTISPKDLDLFFITSDVDEAFNYIVKQLEATEQEDAEQSEDD